MTSFARTFEREYFETDGATSINHVRPLEVRKQQLAGLNTNLSASVAGGALPNAPSKSTILRYYSDGSIVRAPRPISLRVWKAIATSAGKTFEWEGVVLDLKGLTFTARLKNVKGAEVNFSEAAEFDIADVPIGDRDLLLPGGIFRWVVGLESRSGTRQKYSRIVFRRLPAWTARSLNKADSSLKELVAGINWLNDESASSR